MKYLIKIESTPNGVLGVRHAGLDQQYCEAGEQVILNWQPDAKWGLQEAHYIDKDGNIVPIDLGNGNGVVAFMMPDKNISVGGTFKMFVSQDWTEGTNPSKGEVLTVGNNGEPTPIPVDELANKIAEGENDLVDAIDRINPFKGWYTDLVSLQTNHPSPQVGDYAYVKGAESTDPAAIYECTTAGTWSDSGRTADTSNVQTFASGEEVNEISIDNDFVGGSDKIAGAYEVNLLKINTIGGEELVDLSNLTVLPKVIAANKWDGDDVQYKHIYLPVSSGETYKITAKSNYTATIAAVVQQDESPAVGDVPSFCSLCKQVNITEGTSIFITIPKDCVLLYITKIYNNNDTAPAVYKVHANPIANVRGSELGTAYRLYDAIYSPINGVIDKNGKWDGVSVNYQHKFLSVIPGEHYRIENNNQSPTAYAFFTEIGATPVQSNPASLCPGTSRVVVDAGSIADVVIPNGCSFLYFQTKYSTDRTPEIYYCTIGNLQQSIEEIEPTITTQQNKVQRGMCRVIHCLGINFNNTTHKAEIKGVLLSNPNNGNRLTINETEVDYDFNAYYTTAVWLVYNLSTNIYQFVSAGTNTYDQVVIAALSISGNSSASPNTSKVVDVIYSSIINWYIDGRNANTPDIITRNIDKDAAVRGTGKKAVDSDILPLSFIHISDIHTKSNNYKCFKSACVFYEHYNNIKAMIVTGDIVWDDNRDSMDYYDESIQSTTKPVLNVIGNHDSGQWHDDLSSVSTDKQCYDKFIAPYVANWGVVQPADAATEGKSYYYKDFTTEKIRLIVLCEFETEYELDPTDETKLKYSRESRAMRQSQVTWFIDALTNTPNDYGVIVAIHQPLGVLADADNEFVSFDLVGGYKFSAYSNDMEWLAKIVNAYATKSALTLSVSQNGAVVQNDAVLDCSCDFTQVQSEFICCLCGHTHRDYIGHLANYPAIHILCVGADNLLYTSGFQPRAGGTPSEDLFNVVNIDRNRKTIKIIRIGSNASVTGQIRNQMILNYANN